MASVRPPARLAALVILLSASHAAAKETPRMDEVLSSDDECSAVGEGASAACALIALQVRGARAGDVPLTLPQDQHFDEVKVIDDLPEGWNASDIKDEEVQEGDDERDGNVTIYTHYHPHRANCAINPSASECFLYNACHGPRYCIIGSYMIVPGWPVAGMEDINGGNAGEYDFLMAAARAQCGSPSCVLITNPVGHRSQEQFHIHYRQYNGGGSAVKSRLETTLCGTSGWQYFSECGSAKARLYNEFPGVFSEVARAYHGISLANVGITVWFTTACGAGLKTMILATTHCSIEHSISSR